MGKDNVPFHSIIFPSFLLGTRQPWNLVDNIQGLGLILFYWNSLILKLYEQIYTHGDDLEGFELEISLKLDLNLYWNWAVHFFSFLLCI